MNIKYITTEQEIIYDCWLQYSSYTNMQGKRCFDPGGMSVLEDVYDYLRKHKIIKKSGEIYKSKKIKSVGE